MRGLVLLLVIAACAPVVEDAPAAVERREVHVEGDVSFFAVASHARGRLVVTGDLIELIDLDVDDVDGFASVDLRLGVQVTGPCGQADIIQHWDDALGPLPTIKHEVAFVFDGETLTMTSEDLTTDVHSAPVP